MIFSPAMKNVMKSALFPIKAFRMWGARGVVDYILRQGRMRRERSFFLDNARSKPHARPERGITIAGNLSATGSLSKVLRDFALCLKDAGIPFQTFDMGPGAIPDSDLKPVLTPPERFEVCRFSHSVEMISAKIPRQVVSRRARIVFWEYNEGVGDGYPCLWKKDAAIIAMSDFNYSYFRREFGATHPVFKLPYPLRVDVSGIPDAQACRAKFGIPQDAFVVFFNFSFGSGWYRKNPAGAVRAFARAFRHDESARLVFKTTDRKTHMDLEERLLGVAAEEGVRDRIVLLGEWMTERDVLELTNCCDVYLSLHRAEGFGLGCAEAMCLGKAVVATDYSATTEFCKPEHSMPIPFKLAEVDDEEKAAQPAIRFVRWWAEPDIDAAAEALGKLRDDRQFRMRLGADARDFIQKTYSTENFKRAVQEFLG